MTTAHRSPDPDRAEFDRIVARLNIPADTDIRADTVDNTGIPALAGRSLGRPPQPPQPPQPPPRPGDGAFVTICLAVIIPTAMLVRGWIGLLLMTAAIFVAARLVVPPPVHNDPRRFTHRPSPPD